MSRPQPFRLLALASGLTALALLLSLAWWRAGRRPTQLAGTGATATARPSLVRRISATPSPSVIPTAPARRRPSPTPGPPATVASTMSGEAAPEPSPTQVSVAPSPTRELTAAPSPTASSAPLLATPTVVTRELGLRDYAGGFLIGFASRNNFWKLPDAESYETVAASEFNILTPAVQMKWGEIHPARDTYRFEPADQHVAFAERHGMAVHGHTLVWHSTNPRWLVRGTWTRAALRSILVDHIDQVVGHYRGRVAIWDVVNEAFTERGTYRKTLWQRGLGNRYIEIAFRRARAADPGAKLLYNDFNIEELNAKSNAVYAMAVDFQRRGVPLDGIGFQLHTTLEGVDLDSFARNMRRFAKLGLEIYITEADVRLKLPASAEDIEAQARIYGGVLRTCLDQPACKGFQLWGFTDRYSWITTAFPGYGAALILDESYRAKPAYRALRGELKKR